MLAAMDERLATLPPRLHAHRAFLETYRRTTRAVGDAIDGASFEDPQWVQEWDVVFADLYLDALGADLEGARDDGPVGGHVGGHVGDGDGGRTAAVPRPWRLAFDAPASLPPLRHVLLGINAHINYDLPQALLAVIPDDDFTDPVLLARRNRDHVRIDAVLAGRVAAEDQELARATPRRLLDRAQAPLNHLSSKRFLREAREKVWHNTLALQRARLAGPETYAARLAELELLSAARIAELLAPGQVLLRLAVAGFGVVLPPPAAGTEARPGSGAGRSA